MLACRDLAGAASLLFAVGPVDEDGDVGRDELRGVIVAEAVGRGCRKVAKAGGGEE